MHFQPRGHKYLVGVLVLLCPLIAMFSIVETASAQSLYKCGNSYQDRPCATEQESKVIGTAVSPQGAPAGSSDALCGQRGADAVKIVWRREGGQTLEQALSQATSAHERGLVAEVYRARGTAAQVRSRIEADCMAEKERKARYAALLEASKPTMTSDGQTDGGAATKSAAPVGLASSKSNGERGTERKKDACDSWTMQRDNIKSRQRAGGSMRTMEELNRSLKETERMMQQNGCG